MRTVTAQDSILDWEAIVDEIAGQCGRGMCPLSLVKSMLILVINATTVYWCFANNKNWGGGEGWNI